MDTHDIVSRCRFFANVGEPRMERLRKMAQRRRYETGEVIFWQDDQCPGVFIVGEGLVRVYKVSPTGKEHVLHLVSPGSTFAEVAAVGGFPCPATAEAVQPTTCALLPRTLFGEALRDDHQLCLELMGSLAGWVRHLVGLLEDITLRDAMGRVSRYLLEHSQHDRRTVLLPSAKKHMASHLNLTSETLSRTLRRLSEAGTIQSAGDELVVLDREGLEGAAEGNFPLL